MFCQCGCGQPTPIARKTRATKGHVKGQPVRFIAGHNGKTTTHGQTGTRTYETWAHMISRCTDPSNDGYARYGGRGITVCARWRSFENFLADMGERPLGKTIDRWPNRDGNYEPSNCRWATSREQSDNMRHRGPAKKTHCIHGHALVDGNLYFDERGYRWCRQCKADRTREKRLVAKIEGGRK